MGIVRHFPSFSNHYNPLTFQYMGFQDRCHQPLGHLSVALTVLLQIVFYGRGEARGAENEHNTAGWLGLHGHGPLGSLLCE